jgi:hypothetical protein
MAGGAARGFLFGALAFIIQIICTYLLQAALVQGTISDLNGEQTSLSSTLSTGLSLALPVLVISIVSLLAIGLGFLLLVVPGAIFAIGWSVAVPVCVVERTGIKDALSRSWELTKGYRWRIFWLVLMYAIAAYLCAVLVMVFAGLSLAGVTTTLNNTPFIVLTWVLRVVLAVITAIGITAIYYELRTVKEGMAPQELAAAFD